MSSPVLAEGMVTLMADSDSTPRGFSRRAPASEGDMDYALVRVPAAGRVGGICLSPDLLCRDVHYWRRRTTPCTKPDCDACLDGDRPYWRGWIFIWNHTTRGIKILELTKRAMVPLELWYTEHRTLRGALVVTTRGGKNDNGPLFSAVSPGPIDRALLPATPNLAALLERMWHGKRQKLRVLDTGIILPPGEEKREQA